MLLRITGVHKGKPFVAGYDMCSGTIAPIIYYMRGWSLRTIQTVCYRKKWVLEIYEEL